MNGKPGDVKNNTFDRHDLPTHPSTHRIFGQRARGKQKSLALPEQKGKFYLFPFVL
jgi:hypothetical protein